MNFNKPKDIHYKTYSGWNYAIVSTHYNKIKWIKEPPWFCSIWKKDLEENGLVELAFSERIWLLGLSSVALFDGTFKNSVLIFYYKRYKTLSFNFHFQLAKLSKEEKDI
jgi:hypothetical protein